MQDTLITVVGNLTSEPELRFLPSGTAVVNFTVASTPSRFDKASGKWVDQESLFLRCTAFRQLAENIAESLTRGTRVVVQGRLIQRNFETRDGEKRTVIEMEIEAIGPDLRFATAFAKKAERDRPSSPPADDPWGGDVPNDAPPF